MNGYTKQDIDFHRDGYGDRFLPAVKVKVYQFPSSDQVVERFGCCESTAERVIEWAFETQAENFWNDMLGDHLSYRFEGYGLKAHGEGRSSGWVVVQGLPDADEWDGVLLNRWALFERDIQREIDWLAGWEQVEELIDINEWAVDPCAIESMVNTALDAIGAP